MRRSRNLENDLDLERKVHEDRDLVIEKSDPGRENALGREKDRNLENGRDRRSERSRKSHAEDQGPAHRDENARAQGRDRQVYIGSEKIYKNFNGKFREVV